MLEPTLTTQSILIGYDLLMVWLFLMCLNLLLSNKQRLFSFALIFLCMSSVRGIILGFSLLLLDCFLNKRISLYIVSKYFPAALMLSIWSIYHHSQTGWFIFSPTRENNAEASLPFSSVLKQIFSKC